ncbi:MAG TPA: TrkH family potassium uptake protein [Anaerolineae bacterium]|nr:TrkH family potassium uptake protein [Anaerolineae bacterium]
MINSKIVINVLGLLLTINGVLMLAGLPFSWYYGSNDILPIVIASAITLIFGGACWSLTLNSNRTDIGKREGYLIVTLGWVMMSLFGALPFVFSGAIPSYTDAFFETMSGYTTTGASVLNNIEEIPKGILFWRSMTHWIGGMGIIVLSLAIMPILGIGGMQLFVAEVPGPTADKIHPRVKETAKRLWFIYFLLTAIETILLMLGNMSLYDAINHSFATMATGGFSTKQLSIAYYNDQPYIQYVIMLFMYFAGANFAMHYFALKRRFDRVWHNEEFRFYTFSIIVVGLIHTAGLMVNDGLHIERAFRDSMFTTLTIVTTTGFVTADYETWAVPLLFIVFMLMFTGGSAGSTAGGIKVVRLLLIIKNSLVELKRLLHPRAIIPVRLDGRAVPSNIMTNILAFFILYLLIFVSAALIMTAIGLDFISAIGATIACLGNIGPGLGSVGPTANFAHVPGLGKWFLSFLMLLGRLELFTVLILFTSAFWRK